MQLCDMCHMPRDLHMGYDHGRRRCLLARDIIDLSMKFGREKALELARQVKTWQDEQAPFVDDGAG